MDATELRSTCTAAEPPDGLSGPVLALWHAGKGEWDKAHEIVQDDESKDAAWVHAHLHRVEGDEANAGYWYRRAGRPHCYDPVDNEWQSIAVALLVHKA